jgi:hypothetical protein
MLVPQVVGERHYAIAREVRHTLAVYEQLKDVIAMLGREELSAEDQRTVARARQLERFLTQPFFVTEQFTGYEGRAVALADALDGCERILADAFADAPERPCTWSAVRTRRTPGGSACAPRWWRHEAARARPRPRGPRPRGDGRDRGVPGRLLLPVAAPRRRRRPAGPVAGGVPDGCGISSPPDEEAFLAVDGGTLVKCGDEVLVSSPRVVIGPGLDDLRTTIEASFRALERDERDARAAIVRLESDIVRRFVELERHA